MTRENENWIIGATYHELLKRWRFSENDSIFQGESGIFYAENMNYKKTKISHAECVKISKMIGW